MTKKDKQEKESKKNSTASARASKSVMAKGGGKSAKTAKKPVTGKPANAAKKAAKKPVTGKPTKAVKKTKTSAVSMEQKAKRLLEKVEKSLGGKTIGEEIARLQRELDLAPAHKVGPDVYDPFAVTAPDGQRYHAGDRESAWFISIGRPDLAFG